MVTSTCRSHGRTVRYGSRTSTCVTWLRFTWVYFGVHPSVNRRTFETFSDPNGTRRLRSTTPGTVQISPENSLRTRYAGSDGGCSFWVGGGPTRSPIPFPFHSISGRHSQELLCIKLYKTCGCYTDLDTIRHTKLSLVLFTLRSFPSSTTITITTTTVDGKWLVRGTRSRRIQNRVIRD